LAFTIPAYPVFSTSEFKERLVELEERLKSEDENLGSCEHPLNCPAMAIVAENLEKAARKVQSPQQRMEHALSPWVTFLVIPVFAFSNAAVDFSTIHLMESLSKPVTVGVIFGLVFGKFIGISTFCWLAVKLGIGRLPADVTWHHILGVAWLAGIGFTMSLFVAQLAFDEPVFMEQAKLGILFASSIAGMVGLVWIVLATRRHDRNRR
jgi:Na+:H+ antiporter, NhaA family